MAGNEVEQEIVNCFSLFRTSSLDDQWLNNVWNSNLFEINALPSDYQEIQSDTNWASVLRDAANSIRNEKLSSSRQIPVEDNVDGNSQLAVLTDESIISLLDRSVSLKGVIVVTSYFVGRGFTKAHGCPTHSDCEISILAASLYLCIVCLPGSNAFRLFHPVLFERTILLFEGVGSLLEPAANQLGPVIRRRQLTEAGSVGSMSQKRKLNDNVRQARKRSAKKGSRRYRNVDTDSDDEMDEGQDGDASVTCVMTGEEAQSLVAHFCSLLSDIALFLSNYSLKNNAHSLESTAQHLSELLVLECNKNKDANRLISKCLVVLKKLCDSRHGNVNALVCIVMKHLMPIILAGQSKIATNFVTQFVDDVPSGGALLGIRTLLQHLCYKVHEKSDARLKLANIIVSIIDKLPIVAYAKMVEWLLRFAQTAKVLHRLFALELFSLILGHSSTRDVSDIASVPADFCIYLSDTCLLKAVLDRCSDKAAGVRTKALSIVASSAICAEPNLHLIMLKMLTPSATTPERGPRTFSQSIDDGNSICDTIEQPNNELAGLLNSTMEAENTLPDYNYVIQLIASRAMDIKVQVRRAALQLLQSIIELSVDSVTVANVKILQEHCLDVSLVVRKQSMHSLTHLIQSFPENDILHQSWLAGVLQSIVDCESTCQTKCIEAVEEVIIQNIVPYHKSVETFHTMAWTILKKIVMSKSKELWRYLRRSLVVLSRMGKTKSNILLAIQTHIDTDNNAAAWMLLSGLAPYIPMKSPEFVLLYWDNHESTASDNVLRYVLMVIEVVCRSLNTQTADIIKKLATVLLDSVRAPMVISQIVTTMSVLCQTVDENDTTMEHMFKNYCKLIMKHCDKYLASVVFQKKSSSMDVNESCIIHNLFTVGELGLHCPENIPNRTLLILKSFLAPPSVAILERVDLDDLGKQAIKSSRPLDYFNASRFGKPIRRIAFVSLGKLCLQRESLAKECVPAFGHELKMSDDFLIRNNVVVIMADLCKRYTTLVDEYIPAVTACLRDSSLIVRRQTLTLLTNLLQEDYLKWRGPLFFHYLSTLVDESAEIRSFGEYGLLHILNKRHPTMFQQHFVECLFHFNAYKDHEKYNKVIQSEKEVQLFSMSGDSLRDKRSKLYKFMLENMNDEHRFQITTRICQDVLGGVVDGSVKLTMANSATSPSGLALLKDALAVLSSDAIKLATLRSCPQDDVDDGDVAAVVVATAKKTIITQVVKKNAIENIVPIVVSLKHTLENVRSPLLRDLMIYVKELMKDYKNEVKDILAADKQLATEIEYDLKKFEQEQREMAEMRKREERIVVSREIGFRLSARSSNMPTVVDGRNTTNGNSVVPVANIIRDVADNHTVTTEIANQSNVRQSKLQPSASTNELDNHTENLQDVPRLEALVSVAIEERVSPSAPEKNKQKNPTERRVAIVSLERLNASSVSAANISIRMPVVKLPRLTSVDQNEVTVGNIAETIEKLNLKESMMSNRGRDNVVPAILQTPIRNYSPLQKNMLRAISTPHGVITNISFQCPGSIIPSGSLSPIQSVEDSLELSKLPATVLHVKTLDEPLQVAKKRWAVKPSNKRLSLQLEGTDEQ